MTQGTRRRPQVSGPTASRFFVNAAVLAVILLSLVALAYQAHQEKPYVRQEREPSSA